MDLLRHALATLAYRGKRAMDGVPAEFAIFPGAVRTPGEILAHLGDLLDWALQLANGTRVWQPSAPVAWEEGVARFFTALEALDHRLASADPPEAPADKLFQGPIADAFTHVGQLAMLRRLAGCPFRGENYYEADIITGRVGSNQAPARKPF
jgi:hypothetical protein